MFQERAVPILMLAAVAAVTIAATLPPLADVHAVETEKLWIRKVHERRLVDVVIIGDSRVNQGVSPAAVSRELEGARVLNFGFNSAVMEPQLLDDADRRLDPSGLRLMVLGISSLSLLNGSNGQYREILRADRWTVFSTLYLSDVLLRFSPIINSERRRFPFKPTPAGRPTLEPNAAEGWIADSRPASQDALASTLRLYRGHFAGRPGSAADVDRVVRNLRGLLSRDANLRLVLFRFPVSTQVRELEDAESGIDFSVLRAAAESLPRVTWLDDVQHDAYEYSDGSHLSKVSAVAFSGWLGRRLAQIR